MDIILDRRVKSFILAFLATVVLFLSVSSTASATDTYEQANAECQSYIATWCDRNTGYCGTGSGHYSNLRCTNEQPKVVAYADHHDADVTLALASWQYVGEGPSDCGTVPSVYGAQTGRVKDGMTICVQNVSPSGGACQAEFHPSGPSYNSAQFGWQTNGTLSYTGQSCGTGQQGTFNPDGTTDPDPPIPTFDNTDVSPQLCGGYSCYDPNADAYCVSTSTGQACVPGAAARNQSGGCATTGDAAVCAGSPPPSPSVDKVPDPATQITGHDSYGSGSTTQGDQSTVQITVNTYTTGSTAPTSGAKPGDDAPPAPSSAPSNGSVFGGENCDSPPICSGDAVNCAALLQQWRSRCDANRNADTAHKDLAGDSDPPPLPSGDPDNSAIWSDTPTTGNAVADNALNGSFDQSGFGYARSCPMEDLTVPLMGGSFAIPFSKGCVIGPWIQAIVIAFSLLAAARITAG